MASVDDRSIVFLEDWLDIAAWSDDSEIISGGAYTYFYSKNRTLLESSKSLLKNVSGLQVYSGPPQHFNAWRIMREHLTL